MTEKFYYTNNTIDSFFDQMFADFTNIFNSPVTANYQDQFKMPNYPHNLKVDENRNTIIEVAVIGLEKDEISVDIDGSYLNIKLQPSKSDAKDEYYYITHKICQRAEKLQYKISSKQDIDNINIKLDKGLLTIVIPFKEEFKPIKKQLKIN